MTNFTPGSKYATDTMGLILRMEKRKLSQTAKVIYNAAETGNTTIYIPAVVFTEILYLSEKQRISISIEDVEEYLKRFPNYQEFPLRFDVILKTAQIKDINELHDRLIAGTSFFLNVPLITNDPVIQASQFIKTVW
ncbi:MAG: type II toxin-antitoxin system VapC family toxin [bacterium]|nr:type II toxin-antitoxin system VapC family toxin [bacterium]